MRPTVFLTLGAAHIINGKTKIFFIDRYRRINCIMMKKYGRAESLIKTYKSKCVNEIYLNKSLRACVSTTDCAHQNKIDQPFL